LRAAARRYYRTEVDVLFGRLSEKLLYGLDIRECPQRWVVWRQVDYVRAFALVRQLGGPSIHGLVCSSFIVAPWIRVNLRTEQSIE
jgi:hypothetical protein